MIEDLQTTCLKLNYLGQVQGVGMRPFLFRMAQELDLKGQIYNHNCGVTAELEGSRSVIEEFHQRVLKNAARPVVISDSTIEWQSPRDYRQLEITSSPATSGAARHTIQPDAATCEKCWSDFGDLKSRFFNYAFVTCCECGPRWSILNRFPFERSNTSYGSFDMCPDCRNDYQNPNSRRHHAQTLSCPACGPQITVSTSGISLNRSNLESVHQLILQGGVGLVKGLGGFQLVGDAKNPNAIERIRELKSRPSQSLAIMIRDQETFLKMGGTFSDWQRLVSPEAPIISLSGLDHPLSQNLAPDLNELGVMAPTTPLHFMLFPAGVDTLVVTSGNPKGQALPRSVQEIRFSLGVDIDFVVDHNREIVHALDDSVLRGQLILRKARGLTPAIHRGCFEDKKYRLALGADLKNAMALQIDKDIVEFPYCGDLSHPAILERQSLSASEHLQLFDLNWNDLDLSAIDLHPETDTEKVLPGKHSPVPHHLAHAWAAFHECPSQLVLTFDGTGYDDHFELGGGDGFVLKDNSWNQVIRLKPIQWVGGNSSVLEPWKSCVLYFASEGVSVQALYACFPEIPTEHIDVFYAFAVGGGGPMTTSMGRWFDAAATLIEFGGQRQSYEAQAPIRLEHFAKPFPCNLEIGQFLRPTGTSEDPSVEIDAAALLIQLYKLKHHELIAKEHVAFIAHDLMARAVALACQKQKVKSVTGSGGVFQNALFSSLLQKHLDSVGIQFTLPKKNPVNDQCIALGQLYYLEHLHA